MKIGLFLEEMRQERAARDEARETITYAFA